LQLDVTEARSIAAAVATVSERCDHLDVLVNNAGVSGGSLTPPSGTPLSALREAFEVNFFGVAAVTNAFLPLLRNAGAARVINIGSPLGSQTLQAETPEGEGWPNVLPYNASKAGLNALTVAYGRELRDAGIAVVTVDPGFTATDLNGHSGTQTPAEGAALPLLAATVPNLPTAVYLTDHESPLAGRLPW
jgi:NAD(P)-dependent dehydrogenase (short-subunit alcohol dehydrogenase family)